MGLNFSYVLFFPKDRQWTALQGLAALADTVQPPCLVQFPDHTLALPASHTEQERRTLQHDAPKIELALSLPFAPDAALRDYAAWRDRALDDRSPPDGEGDAISIGFVYLTVYADLSLRIRQAVSEDVVLFEFDTTGTHMSLLFSESDSIRRTFVRFLAENGGLSGLFNREMGEGELFWHRGRCYELYGVDPYMMPVQIDALLAEQG